ncbi:enoyl-CoA hydratase-related protein [Dactylosporangium sp. NPDC051485]|uniref:enoyl-CoA hydratase-related protein n=1 Tax=Dactylosporangium sp. NPDC051485 TaxID=3154846 RepID=UPI0034160F78
MRVLLLVSAFNGLSQRTWCALRAAGHHVDVELAVDEATMFGAANLAQPDLILCPYLKDRVPAAVWSRWTTIIIHPGPVGDRGPSSLDWAITDAAPTWGVTALQAVDEMDAGPVWATRTFPMPSEPTRKSTLYNGVVADAALECIGEVLDKAGDPLFTPTPLAVAPRAVPGTTLRPLMRQHDRTIDWRQPAADIVRRIHAADGSPGVRTDLAGHTVQLFDASVAARPVAGHPGQIIAHDDDAVLIAAGGGTGVWIGHAKWVDASGTPGIKLPAADVLHDALRGVPRQPGPARITYRRHGSHIGEVAFDIYNGAMNVPWSRRLATALRRALAQDTRVLIISGGLDAFCHGIDLNAIHASDDPAAAAWASIRAINAVCRVITADTSHTIIAAITGPAGAGGVMLPLGADVVVARSGVTLNAHYDIGLAGSELHTVTLPARVGIGAARRLLTEHLPVDADQAAALGLVDAVGPRDPHQFHAWLLELADQHTKRRPGSGGTAAHGIAGPAGDPAARPLAYWETGELARMALDIFDDRQGFAARRDAFVNKRRADRTPAWLATHRLDRPHR